MTKLSYSFFELFWGELFNFAPSSPDGFRLKLCVLIPIWTQRTEKLTQFQFCNFTRVHNGYPETAHTSTAEKKQKERKLFYSTCSDQRQITSETDNFGRL